MKLGQKLILNQLDQILQYYGNFIFQQYYKFKYQFISDMPRLKKYSQIYGDDLSSGASVVNGVARPVQRISQLSNTNGNTSNNSSNKQSQSESDISNDTSQANTNKQDANTNTNKRYSQNNLKNNRNSHQSGNQNLNGQNKSTQRKRVSKNRQVSGKYNPDQILKKMQEQCAKEQEYRLQQKDQDQTNVQIPGDVLVGFQKKKSSKSNKRDKSGVKMQNKFFNNLEITQFEEYRKQGSNASNPNKNLSEIELQQLKKLEEQKKQIQALKNQKALQIMNQRKNLLQQKVSRIRGRLEFKNAHDDVRFKEHFQQTLDNVRDCQQVDIMIQAPKIFKGTSAKQTDAALFIKNMAANGHQSQLIEDTSNAISRGLSRQKDQKEDKNKKIGRKQFYEQFTRKVKQNKAVQFPVVTNCIFKKTSLDELEYEKNEHLFKQDTRNSMTNKSINQRSSSNLSIKNKERTSIEREKQRQNSNSKGINTNTLKNITKETKQIKTIQQTKQQESQKPKNIAKSTQPTQNKSVQQKREIQKKNEGRSKSKPKNKNKKQNQAQGNEKKSKQKTKKEKNKKKKRRNKKQIFDDQIKALFQQQAEDQSNGYGDNNGQSSQSDDNESVQSIIDRKKVKIVQKHEREARKKYRNDIDKQDEQIMQKIKERILYPRKIKCEYDQSSQSRQRRIQRMEQARKKFEEEDGVDDEKFEQCTKQQDNKQYVKEQEVFQKHLKQLEQQQRGKGQKAPTQKSRKNKSKNKNKNGNAWKDIKVFTKVEALKTTGVNKRGGFINNDEGKVAGHKINNKNNKKASKQKNINF